jgi:hypothetical protein
VSGSFRFTLLEDKIKILKNSDFIWDKYESDNSGLVDGIDAILIGFKSAHNLDIRPRYRQVAVMLEDKEAHFQYWYHWDVFFFLSLFEDILSEDELELIDIECRKSLSSDNDSE